MVSLKPVDWSVTTTSEIKTIPTLDGSTAPSNSVLIPHTGEWYKEKIEVIGKNKIKLHFYCPGIYTETEYTKQINQFYPQIQECSGSYPETVPNPSIVGQETFLSQSDGAVCLEFFFSAIPCGGTTQEPFVVSDLSINGYNPNGFTRNVEIDFTNFISFGGLSQIPHQLSDLEGDVYLWIKRVDNGKSSTPVYFTGHSFTAGNAWLNELEPITIEDPGEMPIPTASPPPAISVTDDKQSASVKASGSVVSDTWDDTQVVPMLYINDLTISESDNTATLTVTLSPPTTRTIVVEYTTSDDTAKEEIDYTPVSGSLTFLGGEQEKEISITLLSNLFKSGKSFDVILSNAVGATLADCLGTININEDNTGNEAICEVRKDAGSCSGASDGGGTSVSDTCTVKVSTNDSVCSYLEDKIIAGNNVIISKEDINGAEVLRISADVPDNGGGLGISRPDGCPSLTVASPAVKNYTAGNDSLFPLFTTGSTANDNNVTFQLQITTGLGAVSSTVSVAGTTKTWTEGDKTFIIDGPYPDVNQVLTGLTYTASANDTGEVKYTAKVTDANGKEKGTCGEQLKFVTNEVFIEYKGACSGELTLSGTNGSISINTRKEDGTFLRNIANQSFQTSLQTTVENIVNEINTVNTTPNFTAQVTGTHKFKVCAAKGLGETANGWYVDANITGGDFVVSGDTSMDGGVTGKIDRPSGGLGDDNFDVLDLIGDFANKVLDDILNPDESQIRIDIPQTEEPIQDIRYRFRGRNTVRIPNNFDPVNRTFSGNWDYVTFNTAYTNDPAWCLLDFMSNINYGCGNELYNRMSSAQQQQLHQDLYTISQRNNETIHGGPRYTVNAVITNKMTKYDVLQAIAGCMHSKVLFLGSNVVRVIQDAPREPVMLVNQTSMSVEGAAYSEKAASSVYNVGVVSYYDPSQYSKLTAKEVRLDDVYDVVPNDQIKNIVAWGVNNEAQAVRHMRKVLYDEAIDGVSIKYQAGIDTRNIIPGDVIRVLDIYNETSSNAYSGRVVSSADSTHITLDRDFTLSGSPEVFITMPDGSIHSTTIIGVADREVTLADAMPLTPEPYAKFNITTGKDYIVTKTHRNAKGVYEVFGVNYDSNKYTTIDGDL